MKADEYCQCTFQVFEAVPDSQREKPDWAK